jgi:hypothetical protein
MQIGAVYPQNALGGDPTAVGRSGSALEGLGFDHLLAYDHVLGAVHADRTPQLTGPYTEHDGADMMSQGLGRTPLFSLEICAVIGRSNLSSRQQFGARVGT